MIDVRVNNVNIFNPLEGKIDEIIEDFVKFYGEEHRERITQRIKNTTFVFTSRKTTPFSNSKYLVECYYKDKTNYIYELLFSTVENYTPKYDAFFKSPQDAYEIKQALTTNKFNYFIYDKITDLVEMFALEDLKYPLKDYGHKTIEDWLNIKFNRYNVEKCLNKIIYNYETHYKYLLLSFQYEKELALKKLSEYDELIEKIESRLDEKLNNIIKNYLFSKTPRLNKDNNIVVENCVETLLALIQNGQERFVNEKDFALFEKNAFINFFNLIGFNLGDDIKAYQQNPEVLNYVFDTKLFEEVLSACKENAKLACKANPYLQDSLNKIQTLNVKGGNIGLAAGILNFVYNNALAGAVMLPYVDKNTNQLKYLCVFSDATDISDNAIYHELNHVVESDLIYLDDKKFIAKTGFEVFDSEFLYQDLSWDEVQASTTCQERKKRSHEIISEIVNDYFSIQILQNSIKDKRIYTFGKPQKSTYSVCHGVFKNFIENNKQKIIDCRLSKDDKAFERFVEKTNLESLASLTELLVIYEQNYPDVMWEIQCEIRQKTGIMQRDVFAKYKDYIYKNYNWSENARKVIHALQKIDWVFESIKNNNKHITTTNKENVKK